MDNTVSVASGITPSQDNYSCFPTSYVATAAGYPSILVYDAQSFRGFPNDFLSAAGVPTSCSGGPGNGAPFYQTPVFLLTASSTVFNEDSTGLPSASTLAAKPITPLLQPSPASRSRSLSESTKNVPLYSSQAATGIPPGTTSDDAGKEPQLSSPGLSESTTAIQASSKLLAIQLQSTSASAGQSALQHPAQSTPPSVGPPVLTFESGDIYSKGSLTIGASQQMAPISSGFVDSGISNINVPSAMAPTDKQAFSQIPTVTLGITFAGVTIERLGSAVIVASQTLVPGSVVTLAGTPVSLAPSATALVVGTLTKPLLQPSSQAADPNPAVVTFAGSPATAASQSYYHTGTQTPVPGNSLIKVSGTSMILAQSGEAVVADSLAFIIPSSSLPIITVASSTLTANSHSEYTIGSGTLIPGSPAITVSGTAISLAISETALVLGSSTIALGSASHSRQVLTFAGSTITAEANSDFPIGAQTLIAGAPVITISGTPISLAPSATALVIDSSTIPLTPASHPVQVITFAGSAVPADAHYEFIAGTQTLIPGAAAITISGTPISLGASAPILMIGSSTIPHIAISGTGVSILTIGGSTITANANSDFVIGTHTLIPGVPTITVFGTPLSLDPSATEVMIGSSTEIIGKVNGAAGLAGVIMSAFSGGLEGPRVANSTTSGSGVTAFTGGAISARAKRRGLGIGYLVVLGFTLGMPL